MVTIIIMVIVLMAFVAVVTMTIKRIDAMATLTIIV